MKTLIIVKVEIAFALLSLMIVSSNRVAIAQQNPTMSHQEQSMPDSAKDKHNAWGVDILVSDNGFGLGGFYRRIYSRPFSGFISFSISEVKDDQEREVVNIFTGQTFVPGKVNRFLLLPLYAGVQYRLFSEEIMDNFRPYLTLALGPSIVYSAHYDREFFSSLGHGQAHYTVGGYIGLGAFFGFVSDNLMGLSARYYFVPLKNGIESLQGVYKKEFGGFYITFNFGSMY